MNETYFESRKMMKSRMFNKSKLNFSDLLTIYWIYHTLSGFNSWTQIINRPKDQQSKF